MSYRARRLDVSASVEAFSWGDSTPPADAAPAGQAEASLQQAEPSDPSPAEIAQQQARLAALERDAFAKGYQQGERAGAEAGATRAEAMLRRLAQTIEELADLRRSMMKQTEHQMVQLALAIARRIVRHEVAVDSELTITMARVALDRIGDSTSVTIRLSPEDFEATAGRRDALLPGSHVTVVPDTAVSRGGCLVQSDFGYVDASVEAQFQELARALLEEEGQQQAVNVGAH